ncbi:MAG TPA: SPOR domain-containing protein [Candidatus Acidoferrales bacterium]|nr:SPOR domain-containing protein [Candidatus Acidoferrales bacterium]
MPNSKRPAAMAIALCALVLSRCSLYEPAPPKASTAGLVVTPVSTYSTLKARGLAQRYKDNLERIVVEIVRSPVTAKLQFSNNIVSTGGIGFFTHSASQSADERYLELILAAPEVFDDSVGFGPKLDRLMAQYGGELLRILLSETAIYNDPEVAGYGLNFFWRTAARGDSGPQVIFERGVVYFRKDEARRFLDQKLTREALLSNSVIFATRGNSPPQLVAYSAGRAAPALSVPTPQEKATDAAVAALTSPIKEKDILAEAGQKPEEKIATPAPQPKTARAPSAGKAAPFEQISKPPEGKTSPEKPGKEAVREAPAKYSAVPDTPKAEKHTDKAQGAQASTAREEKTTAKEESRSPATVQKTESAAAPIRQPPAVAGAVKPPEPAGGAKQPDASVKETSIAEKASPPQPKGVSAEVQASAKQPAGELREKAEKGLFAASRDRPEASAGQGAEKPRSRESIKEEPTKTPPAAPVQKPEESRPAVAKKPSEPIAKAETPPVSPRPHVEEPPAEARAPAASGIARTPEASPPKEAPPPAKLPPAGASSAPAPEAAPKAKAQPESALSARETLPATGRAAPEISTRSAESSAIAPAGKAAEERQKPSSETKAAAEHPAAKQSIEKAPLKQEAPVSTRAEPKPDQSVAEKKEPVQQATAPKELSGTQTKRAAVEAPREKQDLAKSFDDTAPSPKPRDPDDQAASGKSEAAISAGKLQPASVAREKANTDPGQVQLALKPVEGYAVQILFLQRAEAQRWAEILSREGYPISLTATGDGESVRLRVGSFASQAPASGLLERLRKQGLSGFVVHVPKG